MSRMDKDTIASWLRASAAFRDAPDEAIEELTAAFSQKTVTAGQAVVCEGDSGGEFFLLASGSLTVAATKSGEKRDLGNISPGDTFGEIASLTGGRRLASVTATEDSVLLSLPQAAFQSTVRKHPGLTEAVLRSLERYLLP